MLLDRRTFKSKFPSFNENMQVLCRDGKKLGRIVFTSEDSFTVEKGVFFPRDFTLRYDDIREIRDNQVVINESTEEMEKWQSVDYSGWSKVESVNRGEISAVPTQSFQNRYEALPEETVSIPIFEEELEAKKKMHKMGEVSVKKIVHSELKHITVPLMHEEVQIRRVPASQTTLRGIGTEGSFQEKTVNVPVMEEEVEVSKHAVMKEEVRIGKTKLTEQRDVSGEIRKEEVEIDDRTAKINKRKVG
jgi:uncharacterized protein (TIGR02271 family)